MKKKVREAIRKRKGEAVNFIMALQHVKQGGKVKRLAWKERKSYMFSKEGTLLHNKPYEKSQQPHSDSSGYPFVISDEDIYANDWIAV